MLALELSGDRGNFFVDSLQPACRNYRNPASKKARGAHHIHRAGNAGGEWYDQDNPEWVLLLSGKAGLLLENEAEMIIMKPAKIIFIFRCTGATWVAWTDPVQPTCIPRLALHYRMRGSQSLKNLMHDKRSNRIYEKAKHSPKITAMLSFFINSPGSHVIH